MKQGERRTENAPAGRLADRKLNREAVYPNLFSFSPKVRLRVPSWSFVMTQKSSTVSHRFTRRVLAVRSVFRSLFSVLFLLFSVLCGRAAPAFTLPLLDEGGVRAGIESPAEGVSREASIEATLWIETPADREASLPADLRGRFRGFAVIEDFPEGRTEQNGRARAAWRFRLTPGAEGPWRLMPFVLTVRDPVTGKTQDYATRFAPFPEPPPLPTAEGAPEVNWEPLPVRPPWQVVAKWIAIVLGGVLLLVGVWLLARPWAKRLVRAIREHTASPEERARLELERLLSQHLIEQGQIKPFYYALIDIVRRYFERAHALRATRQTTQEFLASLAQRAEIPQAAQAALADFMTAADRVKYADLQATPAQANTATQSARDLVRVDVESRGKGPANAGKPQIKAD